MLNINELFQSNLLENVRLRQCCAQSIIKLCLLRSGKCPMSMRNCAREHRFRLAFYHWAMPRGELIRAVRMTSDVRHCRSGHSSTLHKQLALELRTPRRERLNPLRKTLTLGPRTTFRLPPIFSRTPYPVHAKSDKSRTDNRKKNQQQNRHGFNYIWKT